MSGFETIRPLRRLLRLSVDGALVRRGVVAPHRAALWPLAVLTLLSRASDPDRHPWVPARSARAAPRRRPLDRAFDVADHGRPADGLRLPGDPSEHSPHGSWRRPVPLSTAIILFGGLCMVIRRHTIAQLIGWLILENGVFLGAITLVATFPFIVEAGIFLDLVAAVLIMIMFVSGLRTSLRRPAPTSCGGYAGDGALDRDRRSCRSPAPWRWSPVRAPMPGTRRPPAGRARLRPRSAVRVEADGHLPEPWRLRLRRSAERVLPRHGRGRGHARRVGSAAYLAREESAGGLSRSRCGSTSCSSACSRR